MFRHHRPTKTLITGKSGSGKTTYFERLLSHGFKNPWQTIFVYDWQCEMSERLQIEPCWNMADIPKHIEKGFICYDPHNDFKGRAEEGLLCFSETVFRICESDDNYPQYPRLFACDEIQLLLETSSLPIEIKQIMQTGRRAGLDCAFCAQQFNEVHNKIRSQCTERITFQHEDPYVLECIAKWGFDPEQVKAQSVGEYLYSNDRGDKSSGSLFGSSSPRPEANPEEELDRQEGGPVE